MQCPGSSNTDCSTCTRDNNCQVQSCDGVTDQNGKLCTSNCKCTADGPGATNPTAGDGGANEDDEALVRVQLVSQMKGYIILSKLSLPHFSPILSPSSFAGYKHTSWFNTHPKRELLTPRSFRPILVVVGLVGTRRMVGNEGRMEWC